MKLQNIGTIYNFRFNDRVTQIELNRNVGYFLITFTVDGEKAYFCKISNDELEQYAEGGQILDVDVIRIAQKKLAVNREDWFNNCAFLTIYGNRMSLFEKTETYKIMAIKDDEAGFYYLKFIERLNAPFQIRLTNSFNTDKVVADINAKDRSEVIMKSREIVSIISGLEDEFLVEDETINTPTYSKKFEEGRQVISQEISNVVHKIDYSVHAIFDKRDDSDDIPSNSL